MADRQIVLLSIYHSYTICVEHQVVIQRENDRGELVRHELEPQCDLRFNNHKAVVDQATFDKIRAKFDSCDYGIAFMSVNDLHAKYKNKATQSEANGFIKRMYDKGCDGRSEMAQAAGPLFQSQTSFSLNLMEFIVDVLSKEKAAEAAASEKSAVKK